MLAHTLTSTHVCAGAQPPDQQPQDAREESVRRMLRGRQRRLIGRARTSLKKNKHLALAYELIGKRRDTIEHVHIKIIKSYSHTVPFLKRNRNLNTFDMDAKTVDILHSAFGRSSTGASTNMKLKAALALSSRFSATRATLVVADAAVLGQKRYIEQV